uniref:Uncharacterized protein n=1 Tax=viral metagenome TaxID=1070528 RepID=A0A6C0JDD3_9ZZZZ
MEVDKEKTGYMEKIKFVVKKKKNMTYNIQAVAKMLGLPNKESYDNQCRLIISFLESKRTENIVIDKLLNEVSGSKDLCDILVKSLYELFSPEDFPKKSPIQISEKKYKELIQKKKDGSIEVGEELVLDEALNCKYCHCVKKLYLQNKFNKFINNTEPKYNPYAICLSSIYKNRDIDVPSKISYKCRDKYTWYSKN